VNVANCPVQFEIAAMLVHCYPTVTDIAAGRRSRQWNRGFLRRRKTCNPHSR